MALIEINWSPSHRELRQFAGIWFPAFFALVGGMIWYFSGTLPTTIKVIWGVVLVISVIGVLKPAWMRPLFIAWMGLAFPIGWTMLHLLLAVIFYVLMTPIGMVMRLFGRDAMERRFDRSAPTYWVAHNPGGDTARYFRQS
jgi:hypothetical protein